MPKGPRSPARTWRACTISTNAYLNSLHGVDKAILQVKYRLMSRPLIYQLADDDKAMAVLRKVGAAKLRMTDAYDRTWTLDL